jgi:hypothetical protein
MKKVTTPHAATKSTLYQSVQAVAKYIAKNELRVLKM